MKQTATIAECCDWCQQNLVRMRSEIEPPLITLP